MKQRGECVQKSLVPKMPGERDHEEEEGGVA